MKINKNSWHYKFVKSTSTIRRGDGLIDYLMCFGWSCFIWGMLITIGLRIGFSMLVCAVNSIRHANGDPDYTFGLSLVQLQDSMESGYVIWMSIIVLFGIAFVVSACVLVERKFHITDTRRVKAAYKAVRNAMSKINPEIEVKDE